MTISLNGIAADLKFGALTLAPLLSWGTEPFVAMVQMSTSFERNL